MSATLPDQLDPWRAVKTGLAFAGQVALHRLPRLAAVVVVSDERAETLIDYSLRFERNPEHRAVVMGQVQARLWLPCQRCLGEVEIEIDAPLRLALLRTEQDAESLPDDLEPLVVGEEPLSLLDVIEDELLLAIPVVPRHDSGRCKPPEQPESARPEPSDNGQNSAVATASDQPNPFAVLAGFKPKRSD